jgi:hypothetical protein
LDFLPSEVQAEVGALGDEWQRDRDVKSVLLTDDLEKAPAHIAVDSTGNRLAVCVDCYTLVIGCCSGKVLARLEGHNAPVT